MAHPVVGTMEQVAIPTLAKPVVVAGSHGISKIRHLDKFLQCDIVSRERVARNSSRPEAVLVWGRKATSQQALNYASDNRIPVWYLEDGWIRSSAQNAHSRLSYSLLVDKQGVYYDPSSPSEIETLLNLNDAEFAKIYDADASQRAQRCRKELVAHNITKYNFCKQADFSRIESSKKLVLVLDQTLDDASVTCGGMDQRRFDDMLLAAIEENPNAQIVVRTHPDVVHGSKLGYLKEKATQLAVTVLPGDDNPMAWVKRADHVYTGTSQLGYEALLAGTKVSVFGRPIYAGWGITDDRLTIESRVQSRSVDELFYISHLVIARYCNPITGDLWTLEETIEHVKLQQRMFALNAGSLHCTGISLWKRGYIKQYLRSPDGEVVFKRSQTFLANGTAVTWGFRKFATENSAIGADGAKIPVHRIEDGFLRSTGLGSDFTAPGSLVVDQAGMYFDPATPSDLEQLLNDYDCDLHDIKRAMALRQRILKGGISKYNIGESGQLFPESVDNKCVLVVGQVEDDQSVQRGCDSVNTNEALLAAVRALEPEAWVVYKPHPDVEAGNRKGLIATEVIEQYADAVDRTSNIADCLDRCDELHTMTSLAGFEALMRGKKVVTYGSPFYAGWGLTSDQIELPARYRTRTLDELVFIVLIQYPRYVDIETGEFTTPENLISRIEQLKSSADARLRKTWAHRQLNKVVNIIKGVRYAP